PANELIIKTADIPYNPLCSSTLIWKITQEKAGLHNNTIISKIGEGSQGNVYLLNGPVERQVLKTFDLASSLLIEANAMIGLQLHGHQKVKYEVSEIMTDLFPTKTNKVNGNDESKLLMNSIRYIDTRGTFCAKLSYIEGTLLRQHNELQPKFRNNLRLILSLFIQLLRQIQAIHFSLNHYGLTLEGNRDIFNVQSYANFHADIHAGNIIVHKFTPDELELVIIDFGGPLLKAETRIKNEGIISKHRILNFGQNVDFCMLAMLILRYFYGIRVGRPILGACRDLRINLFLKNLKHGKEKHFMTYLGKLYDVIGDDTHFVPIYQMLFSNLVYPMDYSGWTNLGRLLNVPL
ncbi:hypothetical protein SNEBB_004148, partial [Seison nebaliae]